MSQEDASASEAGTADVAAAAQADAAAAANQPAQDVAGGEAGDSSGASGELKTLMTRGVARAEDTGAEDKAEAPKDGEDKDTDLLSLVPENPDGYDLKFADGIQVDQELLGGFKSAAHELGIPSGQAQKLADFYAKYVETAGQAAQKAQLEALVKARDGWEDEIKSRPKFEEENKSVERMLTQFGSQKMYELLDQTLLGSHPEMFDFMVRVGEALTEAQSHKVGAEPAREIPLIDRLWPDMK